MFPMNFCECNDGYSLNEIRMKLLGPVRCCKTEAVISCSHKRSRRALGMLVTRCHTKSAELLMLSSCTEILTLNKQKTDGFANIFSIQNGLGFPWFHTKPARKRYGAKTVCLCWALLDSFTVEALAYLHGQNLAHGHLCPESFLVDEGKLEKRVGELKDGFQRVRWTRRMAFLEGSFLG